MIRIGNHDAIYVSKDSCPFAKSHPVLTEIRRCLRTIPLKDGPFKGIPLYFLGQILQPHFDQICA
jgi:hypothetical protein